MNHDAVVLALLGKFSPLSVRELGTTVVTCQI
jgi:hypothetical protein